MKAAEDDVTNKSRPLISDDLRSIWKALATSTTALVIAVSTVILVGVLVSEGGVVQVLEGATCLILEHSDEYGQRGVIWTLGKMGTTGHVVLGKLVVDAALAVRRVALHRIERSGPAHWRLAIPALADVDPELRSKAIEIVCASAPPSDEVAALVSGVANDPDPGVRNTASYSLARLGPAMAPILAALLADEHENTVLNAALNLDRMKTIPVSAVPILADSVRSGGQWAVWSGCPAMARAGIVSVAPLRSLLRDTSADTRAAVLSALGSIAPWEEEVVADIAMYLDDPDESVRWSAIEALQEFGDLAAPYIRVAVDHPVWEIRYAATEWLVMRGELERGALEQVASTTPKTDE